MNIAMLGHKRMPSREGGIEVVVEELSTRMVAAGHSVTCFNRKGNSGMVAHPNITSFYEGVRINEVFTVDKKGLSAMTSSFFACLITGFGRYDVVHIHAEGPAFFSFIPCLLGKRVIVTVHGLDWQRAKWGRFASWYIKRGEKHAARFAHEIIVLSEHVKDYFQQQYNRETCFIPNGVKRPEYRIIEQISKFGLERDGYVLYLGRIVPEKGINILIEAWRKIKSDKKLVIAGESSDTQEYFEELKKQAEGDSRIIFTGFVQGRILEELYSNAYVYCLPSELEGMPLSLMEAMSYGNCCLISDIPECTEVVGDKALSFKNGSAEDLQDKLAFLIDNEASVRRYKDEASDYICGRYSWDDTTERTLELYGKR